MSVNLFEIIIVNWNGLDFLKPCLASIERQTCRDFTVTVVDNGSTDGSLVWLKENHPEVKIIELNENLGFAEPNNIAAAESESKYLILLNNDIELEPDFIERIKAGLKQYPQSDMAAVTMIQQHARDRIDNLGMEWTWAGVARQKMHGKKKTQIPEEPQWIFGPSGGAGVYLRKLFIRAGGFDTSFFAYCEDIDLNLRLRSMGVRCLLIPDALCYHLGSATANRDSDRKFYLIHRNQTRLFIKNFKRCSLWKNLLPYLLYNFLWLLRATLQGRLRLFLRAKGDYTHKG